MVNNELPADAGPPAKRRLQQKPGETATTLTVQALDHLVVQVSDLELSARWYERVLGMTREDTSPAAGQPPRTEMRFGRQKINLRPIGTSKEDWFTADLEAAGSEDLCFLTDSTPDEVVQHLRNLGVTIVTGPGPRRGAQGTLMSVYCRDPDGSLIEIASYLKR
jgi:catechol 2,3-dioxygenase-like lactoylglutathione lyase family enzyme